MSIFIATFFLLVFVSVKMFSIALPCQNDSVWFQTNSSHLQYHSTLPSPRERIDKINSTRVEKLIKLPDLLKLKECLLRLVDLKIFWLAQSPGRLINPHFLFKPIRFDRLKKYVQFPSSVCIDLPSNKKTSSLCIRRITAPGWYISHSHEHTRAVCRWGANKGKR